MKGKQAVLETSIGTIVIDLLPEAAPNHVGLFIKTAEEGGYNGTIFHRVIKDAIIQGGDPLLEGSGEGRTIRHRRLEPAPRGAQQREEHARRCVSGSGPRQS
jgi:cyclophilin family peptidyl-prolyl cis-trans isomerase